MGRHTKIPGSKQARKREIPKIRGKKAMRRVKKPFVAEPVKVVELHPGGALGPSNV